jgi:hypothetical protein
MSFTFFGCESTTQPITIILSWNLASSCWMRSYERCSSSAQPLQVMHSTRSASSGVWTTTPWFASIHFCTRARFSFCVVHMSSSVM